MSAGIVVLVAVLFVDATPARAQTYSADARRIALGGAGSSENIAARLIDVPRPYGSVVLPFGVFQIVGDIGMFDPASDDYNPVRATEYAANPLHYTFDRGRDHGGYRLINDLVHARLDPDLTRYRGFAPATSTLAEGLAFPSFGRTFTVWSTGLGTHGIYLGAGPYVATRATGQMDSAFATLLAGGEAPVTPDAVFLLGTGATSQLALAGTLGYRARLPLPARIGGARTGLYVGANVHYLHGLWLDHFGVDIRLETDAAGLITAAPSVPPVTIARLSSTAGRGRSVDVGVAIVAGPWQAGLGANGIANRIDWRSLERERFVLASVLDGGGYLQSTDDPGGDRRIRLPVDYVAEIGYHGARISVLTEYGRGFMGRRFHAGVEQRIGRVELRVGTRFNRDAWYPSVGVGLNVQRDLGIDLALFSLSSSLERRRQTSLAVSVRIGGS